MFIDNKQITGNIFKLIDMGMAFCFPGTFPSYLTMAELRAGNMSELRNPTIAKVMYSRKTVETWGRGIKLILDECAKANLPEPQILVGGGYTRTVFMRPVANSKDGMRTSGSDQCHGSNEGNEGNREGNEGNHEGNLERIIKAIRLNPRITIAELEKILSLSHATIERAQKYLQAAGRLRRVGGTRGHLEVLEK